MNAIRILTVLLLVLGINAWRRWRSLDSTRDLYRDRYGKQPNIVYIMSDDMGWNDVGFHNPKVKTPNLDALRAKGIELTQSYMQTICSPSRSAFMTGKYPSNNGFQLFVHRSNTPSCLPIEHKTIFQYMKDEGYTTKYVGKWHLGSCDQSCLPQNRGVDEFKGILSGVADYYNWSDSNVLQRYVNGGSSSQGIGTHMTLKDTSDASQMILSHQGQRNPLFMWVTPTAPHEPLETTEAMFNVHDFLNATDPETRQRRQYLGLVSAFDDLVGQVMTALDQAHMARNTIVIFSSDNGGASPAAARGNFAFYANNYPLRNGKYAFTEGGVRVPTLYYDPRLARYTRNTERDFLMHVTDWLPTLVHLGSYNASRTNVSGIDGVSQLANLGSCYNQPAARQYNLREEMLVALTSFDQVDPFCATDDGAFRWRDFKLIYGNQYSLTDAGNVPTEWDKPEESPELPTITGDSCYRTVNGSRVVRCLFNLRDDPNETRNLYDDEPVLVAQLIAKIEAEKRVSVKPVFRFGLGINNVTVQPFGDYLVPRSDYCIPATDFPLEANDPACYS